MAVALLWLVTRIPIELGMSMQFGTVFPLNNRSLSVTKNSTGSPSEAGSTQRVPGAVGGTLMGGATVLGAAVLDGAVLDDAVV